MVVARQNRPEASPPPEPSGPSLDDLKKQVEEQQKEASASSASNKDDPRRKKAFVFNFEHELPDGTLLEGRFENQILTIRQKQAVAILMSQMLGGCDLKSIDEDVLETTRILAHLTFSLTMKPTWADDLRNQWDEVLLMKLYGEVMRHEATFRGLVENQGSG